MASVYLLPMQNIGRNRKSADVDCATMSISMDFKLQPLKWYSFALTAEPLVPKVQVGMEHTI